MADDAGPWSWAIPLRAWRRAPQLSVLSHLSGPFTRQPIDAELVKMCYCPSATSCWSHPESECRRWTRCKGQAEMSLMIAKTSHCLQFSTRNKLIVQRSWCGCKKSVWGDNAEVILTEENSLKDREPITSNTFSLWCFFSHLALAAWPWSSGLGKGWWRTSFLTPAAPRRCSASWLPEDNGYV